ncbi:uncharacterized protein METZ01_LOCUS462817, partial [marine metagenome]
MLLVPGVRTAGRDMIHRASAIECPCYHCRARTLPRGSRPRTVATTYGRQAWCVASMTAMMARGGSPSTLNRTPVSVAVRPFLKWAGGKRQLLPALSRFHPSEFGAYSEPFLGSGALFFDLHARGRLEGHHVVLMDNNP